jgi:sugar/nucleoside kinase (ribokinase family)
VHEQLLKSHVAHCVLAFICFRVPGGSAANVMKGLANISAGSMACKFMGMVGTDAVAQDYMDKLKQQNVQPILLVSNQACCCTAVKANKPPETGHAGYCGQLCTPR